MTAPVRRGACPGLLAPMATGDGLLVRLPAGLGALAMPALKGITGAAEALGSGIIEVTARGSIQARGFGEGSAARFAEALFALGIAETAGPAIVVGPLAGLDPGETLDVRPLAASLRGAVAAFAGRLGPKVSVVLDGGGGVHLGALSADVRFTSETTATGPVFHASVAGDGASAAWLGAIRPAAIVPVAVALLAVIASHEPDRRARDIFRADGAGVFRAAIALWLVGAPRPLPPTPAEPIGSHSLGGGRMAVGIGLAFGQTDTVSLRRLAATAEGFGAEAFAPAPGRVLVAVGIRAAEAGAFSAEALRLGFIVDAGDPRRKVIACAGKPACASALMPARDIAPAVVAAALPLLGGAAVIHLSGCAKGCAHPGVAALTLVGEAGGYGVVVDGTARVMPALHIDGADLTAWLGGLGGTDVDGVAALAGATR